MAEKGQNIYYRALIVTTLLALIPIFNIALNAFKLHQYKEQTTQEIIRLTNNNLAKVNVDYVKCLATNIYHEAGSEPFMGKVAVARVVMNRVKYGFASNPCKVIYQTSTIPNIDDPTVIKKICQFSWVCEGKTTPNKNNPIYVQAEEIARRVLVENMWADVLPANIVFFHNKTVDPDWKYQKVLTIGNHVFYGKTQQNN